MQIIEELEKTFPTESSKIIELFNWDIIDLFKNFLESRNLEGGFFSKKDSDSIIHRHLLESIYFVYTLVLNKYVSRETKIADVGTGPGLPGFLFFCLKDQPYVTLIDSSQRKLSLTETWSTELCKSSSFLKLKKNLHFVYERAEGYTGQFDLIVMRATIPYPFSIEVICRMAKKNSRFCPFLGRELDWSEVESRILSDTGFTIEKEILLESLSFLGERKIKVLKKIADSKHGIPRDWKYISKESKEAKWVK